MITLTPKSPFRVPINGESITPDSFAGKTPKEIASLPMWEGNRRRGLSDLFETEGEPEEEVRIRVVGDLSKVRRVGASMTGGEILVEGNVGMHLGEEMSGGKITVAGNAGSWTGSMMKDGTIIVKGNVDDYLGAPYRGLTAGMKGGTIIVEGDAGSETGCYMAGGTIRIRGDVGLLAGIHMQGGVLLVEGDVGERVGAEMKGGRIVVLGGVPSVLPGFIVDEIRSSVRVGEERMSGPFYAFKGDVTESWNGSLFVAVKNNPHLKGYEAKIA